MKRITLTLVSLLLALGAVPLALAANFPDVPSSHPNYTAIMFLKDRSVIRGYEDGTYKPTRNVTRAEFLKIIMLAAGHAIPSLPLSSDPFPDVSGGLWSAGYIKAAVDLGVVSGYPDRLFRPDRTVSRVEALKMMLKANGITEFTLSDGTSFSDVPAGVWYRKFALYALTAHLFDPSSGNKMLPDLPLTRALVAEMVYRFYQYRPDLLPGVTPTPTPTPTSSTFAVTSLSLTPTPASYSAPCPAFMDVTFHAVINANGRPGTVTYHWTRSDGSTGSDQTVTFASGEMSKTISVVWSFGAVGDSGSVWERLAVTSPNAMTSNQATVNYNCAATSNSVTGVVYTVTPDLSFACGFDNNYNVEANVQLAGTGPAGTLKYRWHFFNGGYGPWLETGYGASATHVVVNTSDLIQNIWANATYEVSIEILEPSATSFLGQQVIKSC